MSKNKNPLKDLDLFLKQQASSLVNPTPLSERVKTEEKVEIAAPRQVSKAEAVISTPLAAQLKELAQKDKPAFYDLLIEMAEKDDNPENAMLINTVIYLKNGDNWQAAVREYWKNR